MASYQAFNSMMDEFLNELIQTFPEEKSLKVQYNAYLTLKKANPRKVVEGFMQNVTAYSDRISKKDESIFTEDIEFLKKINITKWWNNDLSQNTKDAIWQYLNTLLMLGTTITSIPADMLKSIEGMAEGIAGQMGDSNGTPNMGSLFSGIQNILGNMNENQK